MISLAIIGLAIVVGALVWQCAIFSKLCTKKFLIIREIFEEMLKQMVKNSQEIEKLKQRGDSDEI